MNAAPLILLVEDYEANILVAGLYLDYLGYAYEVARNGNQAVEMARSGKYAVILMDVRMPDMDGEDATRAIRALDICACGTNKPIVIIGMTANAMSGDRAIYIAAGMDDYITKPINEQTLRDKLAQYTQ